MIEFHLEPLPVALAVNIATWGMDIRSFREPFKRSIQQVMAPSFQKNFDVGGRPKWQPLSEDTIRQKTELGLNKGTLVRKGALKRVAGQLNIWDIKSDSAVVTGLPGAEYGGVHQVGFEPNNLPERPFMLLQDEDEDKVADIFGDWILERALASGVIARLI